MKKRHFVEPPARAGAASPDPWSNKGGGSSSGVGGGGQGEGYEDEALVQAHAWGCWKVRVDRFSPDYATWRARMQRRQATGASVDCREKKDDWGTAATPPADTGKGESEHGGSSWLKERVEEERRARPDCYGIVSDSTAGDCERDPWAAERKVERSVAGGGTEARDGQWDKGAEWAVRRNAEWKSAEESQSEYARALADTLGSDPQRSTDGDYLAALRDLERMETESGARGSGADNQTRRGSLYDEKQSRHEGKRASSPRSAVARAGTKNRQIGPSGENASQTGRSESYSCKVPDQRVISAIKRVQTRAARFSGVTSQYCGAVNLARVMIWKSVQCLKDATLNATERAQLRTYLAQQRENLRTSLKGYQQLSASGARCDCWTSICTEDGSMTAASHERKADRGVCKGSVGAGGRPILGC